MRDKRTALIGLFSTVIILSGWCAGAAEPQKDFEIAVTKGTLSLESGEYPAAISSLKEALDVRPGDKAATVLLASAYARSGDPEQAKALLTEALARDPSDGRIQYELGAVCAQMKDLVCARARFTEAAAGATDEEVRKAAQAHLDRLEAGEAGAGAGKFALSVLAGLQYDSNVILEPSVPITPGEEESDWRAVALFSARYPFMKEERSLLEAGYLFYQSLHQSLEDFNVQQHALDLFARTGLGEQTSGSLLYKYSYTYVGGERYSAIHRIAPAVTLDHSSSRSTDLFYAHEFKTYYESDLFAANEDRSGGNDSAGFAHKEGIAAGMEANIGYAYDRDATDAAWWAYRGHKGWAGLTADLGSYRVLVSASYYDKRYDAPPTGYTEKRHDQTQEYSVHLIRSVGRKVNIDLSDLYVVNASNLGPFDYTRNIVGLFVVVSL